MDWRYFPGLKPGILVFCFIVFSCATTPFVEDFPEAEEPKTGGISSGELSPVPEKKPPVKVTDKDASTVTGTGISGITPDPWTIGELRQEALMVLSGAPLLRKGDAGSSPFMTLPSWLDSRLESITGSQDGYVYLDREGNILEPGSGVFPDLSPRFWETPHYWGTPRYRGELTLSSSGGMAEGFSGYLTFPFGIEPEITAAGLFDAQDGSWQNYETEDIQGKIVFITSPSRDPGWPALAAAQAALWGARAAVIQGADISGTLALPALPILHVDPVSGKRLKELLSRGPADAVLKPVPIRDTGPGLPAAALAARIAGGGTAPDLIVVAEPGNSVEELAGVLSWELGLFKAVKESREEPPGDVVFVFPLTRVSGLWTFAFETLSRGREAQGVHSLLLTPPGRENLYPGKPILPVGAPPVLLDAYKNNNYPGFSFTRFFSSFFDNTPGDSAGRAARFWAVEPKIREAAAVLDRLSASGALNPAESSRLEALCIGFFLRANRNRSVFPAGGVTPRFLHAEPEEALQILDLALEKVRLKDSSGAGETLSLLENLRYARYFTAGTLKAAGMGNFSDLGDLMLSFTLFPGDDGDTEGREAELLYWRERTMRELNKTLDEEILLLENFLEAAGGIISGAAGL